MHTQSIHSMISALQAKRISSLELIEHYIERINKYRSLNAFITVDEEHARRMAIKADKLLAKGNAPILTGIPMAHKDIFCTKNMLTTCASRMLANFNSPYDATIVKRLKDSGAIMLGKTNMDEFGMGSTGESSYFGLTKNPWNTNCVSGGSSSGSASAVAARIIPFATTTDTGGSTRQPAAFCGLTGIKPTYGLISRYGQIAYASSFDQAGIVANNSRDLAITTQVIAGFDEMDSTTIERPVESFTAGFDKPIEPLRIGLPSCLFKLVKDDEIRKSILDATRVFEGLGAEIVEIELNLMDSWLPCYHMLASAEASSNLARFDGVHFGYRTENHSNIRELITKSRSEGFGDEVKKRILTGTYILSSGGFDDYYVKAQKVRQLITDELKSVLTKVDLIITPTTPSCAFKIGYQASELPWHKLSDTFTVAANIAGLPAISIPSGFSTQGMPIGMQFIGDYFSESLLFQVTNAYQQCTDWHKRIPSLGAIE
ncbi:MAG: Asp-tRNA(Asn)/Glu-tRNA(Gln) amidotransferase subunit GatA [Legionellaceae bacterium]|nr:Asp-tRNA(Asn)/Glu-tRNA(Gln) amidotransferase subunit GatA [Legionellaceae bacterium]